MSRYVGSELRRLVELRANRSCEYCLVHESDTYWGCQVDHIISEKHGGTSDAVNLAYACALCNRAKGSDVCSFTASTGQFIRFFNPRTGRWNDHFELQGAAIVPLSLIGTVTANILRVNTPERLLEREILIKLGRFPPSQQE